MKFGQPQAPVAAAAPSWSGRVQIELTSEAFPSVGALKTLCSPQFTDAREALNRGNLDRARVLLGDLIGTGHASAPAFHLRGEVEIRARAFAEAIPHLLKAVELAPSHVSSLHGLAYCHFCLGALSQAGGFADRILAVDPLNVPARLLRGAIAAHSGDNAFAALIYQGLATELPGHKPSLLGLGHSLRIIGKTAEAVSAYREILQSHPESGEAWACLSALKTYRFTDADIQAMLTQSRRQGLPANEQLQFHYALGRAFFDLKEDEAAFQHYDRANALSRQLGPDDPVTTAAEARQWAARTIQAFARSESSTLDHVLPFTPIFIVGLPRSGTTLVEQIIGSHPQVEVASELPYLHQLALQIMRSGADLTTLDRSLVAEQYLAAASVHRKTVRPFLVDKLPINFRHVAFIRAIFPEARIVDVRRHPLGNLVGMFRQNFLNLPEYSGTFAQLAAARLDYTATMERFAESLPQAVTTVIYEQLVDDTEKQIRRLLDKLRLPFDPGCLRWYDNGQPVRTPSSEQVRQPIFRSALSEWQRFEPWLGEAKAMLAAELARYPEIQ